MHATAVVLPAALAVGEQSGRDRRRGARRGGGRLRDRLPGRRRRAARLPRPRPARDHGRRGLLLRPGRRPADAARRRARPPTRSASPAARPAGCSPSSAPRPRPSSCTRGSPSQAGILAARLAAAGATGPATVFDGPHGVYDALAAGSRRPGRHRGRTSGHGGRPPGSGSSRTRPASSRTPRSPRSATAMATGPFDADEVAAVQPVVHPDSASVVCDTGRDLTRPATPYAAKFSLPWCVAAMLSTGSSDVDTFAEESPGPSRGHRPGRQGDLGAIPPPPTVAADAPGEVTHHPDRRPAVTGSVHAQPGRRPATAVAGGAGREAARRTWADRRPALRAVASPNSTAARRPGDLSSARQPRRCRPQRRRRLRHGLARDQTCELPVVSVRGLHVLPRL